MRQPRFPPAGPLLQNLRSCCKTPLPVGGSATKPRQQKTFARTIGVGADIVERTAQQDAALGRLVKASGDLYTATEEAADQVADRAQELGEAILGAVEERVTEGRDPGRGLQTHLGEAFRLYEDARGRPLRLAGKKERALRPQPRRTVCAG